MMKVFDLPSLDLIELTESQLIEMTAENFAVATNNVDKIAYGGSDKIVYVQQISTEKDEAGNQSVKLSGDPFMGMVFNSAITKVEFFGAKHLLALSEDQSAQIMDLETNLV